MYASCHIPSLSPILRNKLNLPSEISITLKGEAYYIFILGAASRAQVNVCLLLDSLFISLAKE